MKVFVTGASGFVGSAVVEELLSAGHEVLGLVRSESGADKLSAIGAQVLKGDVNDLDLIRQGAAQCDAVIHTAFNHDFSRFQQSCEDDRKVVTALGEAVAGSGKPVAITSGIGILNVDHLATETDTSVASRTPRIATEEAANEAGQKGADVYLVRLPPSVHGDGDHGFVPMLIDLARQKGEVAYINEGSNRWPAVHRYDAAKLYRLIVEKRPSLKVLHAVAEEGLPYKEIAETIGREAKLQVVSKTGDEISACFTWFTHFAQMDCPSSSARTREVLDWQPTGPGLLDDIVNAGYIS